MLFSFKRIKRVFERPIPAGGKQWPNAKNRRIGDGIYHGVLGFGSFGIMFGIHTVLRPFGLAGDAADSAVGRPFKEFGSERFRDAASAFKGKKRQD
jgi:hypothetical protein